MWMSMFLWLWTLYRGREASFLSVFGFFKKEQKFLSKLQFFLDVISHGYMDCFWSTTYMEEQIKHSCLGQGREIQGRGLLDATSWVTWKMSLMCQKPGKKCSFASLITASWNWYLNLKLNSRYYLDIFIVFCVAESFLHYARQKLSNELKSFV